jgi:hypothetical protein
MGPAWVVIGAGLLLAVALSAHVKRAFGIVVACQISRRIRAPFAELDPHVPPPVLKQQTSSPSRVRFAGAAHAWLRPSGLLRLRSIFLTGITDISSPAIASMVVRLRGLRLMAQSYVGKRPISKGIGRGIRRFVLHTRCPASVSCVFEIQSAVCGYWRRERIADFASKCSNPPRWTPGTRCDDA